MAVAGTRGIMAPCPGAHLSAPTLTSLLPVCFAVQLALASHGTSISCPPPPPRYMHMGDGVCKKVLLIAAVRNLPTLRIRVDFATSFSVQRGGGGGSKFEVSKGMEANLSFVRALTGSQKH